MFSPLRTVSFLRSQLLARHVGVSVIAIQSRAARTFICWQQPQSLARAYSITSSLRVRAGEPKIATSQIPAPLTAEQYHKLSDAYIDTLLVDFEELQEEDEEVDVEYSAGVLNLKIPAKGTYVINKQPPNKQIWLSSPISGPKRYDYVLSASVGVALDQATDQAARESTKAVEGGQWVYLRDGSSLSSLLKEELGVELTGLEED